MRALPRVSRTTRPLAYQRQFSSDDNRLSFNRRICLPEANQPWHNLVRRSDTNQIHVVVRMVDDALQKCNEFSVALNRNPSTAKIVDGVLQNSQRDTGRGVDDRRSVPWVSIIRLRTARLAR